MRDPRAARFPLLMQCAANQIDGRGTSKRRALEDVAGQSPTGIEAGIMLEREDLAEPDPVV